MSSKEAPTDSSPRLGAVCWGALEVCHPSLPLGPAGTAGGAGKALRGCLSSHPHREQLRRWKESGRGSVGWPPPRKQKGTNIVFVNTTTTLSPIQAELDSNPGFTPRRTVSFGRAGL